MKKIATGLAATIILLAAGSSLAGIDSTSHTFNLEILDGCGVDTTGLATDLGLFQLGSPTVNQQSLGNVDITCIAPQTFDLGLDKGLNYNPAILQKRHLSDGAGGSIRYALTKTDGNRFGDVGLNAIDTGYTETILGWPSLGPTVHPGGGTTVSIGVNANIFIDDATSAGIYSDTINVVVVW